MSTSETTTRRLVRRTDDRVIAGVASGVADLLGIDPVLARIGFVVLAFAGGAGVIAYLALWLLTPEVEGGATPMASGERGPAFWIAIGLFVLAALAMADSMADRSVVWPLVLIGAGVALWRSDGSRSRADRAAPAPPTASTASPAAATASASDVAVAADDAAPAPTAPVAASTTQQAPTWTPPPAPSWRTGSSGPQAPGGPSGPGGSGDGGAGWTPPPARDRERSVLGRLTVGAALLAVGVLAILDATDVLTLTVQDGFAVALLVVGLGLVVGTWVGRARWLVFPALLVLVPGLVLSTVAQELDVPLGAGIGERSVGTTATADVDPLYELGIGELTLNLGELDLDGGEVATSIHVGVGRAVVVVPDDAEVDVTWHVVGGQVELIDGTRQGRALEGREVFPGAEGAGTVVLDIEVAVGQVEVVRARDRSFPTDPFGDTFDGVEFGPRRS